MTIVIANSNPIHASLEERLKEKYHIFCVHRKEELTKNFLDNIRPRFIFFPHWSYLIPAEIFESYECILFHMTDLPYGRGGSPLQNLIALGHQNTQISALRVEAGIDAGPVYLKEPLSLLGTAEEIFLRLGRKVELMIDKIIKEEPAPFPQNGEVVFFKRRKPAESSLEYSRISDLEKLYDHIRMLDAEGYPKAFLEFERFRFEFSRASLKKDGIIADVRITKK